MAGSLNWVVALMPEARVLIEAFRLKRVADAPSLFPIYESASAEVRLIVSGIGKVNAGAAAATLATWSGAVRGGVGWINFGIAGCSESRYGEPLIASKVTDSGNGQSWYPVPAWSKKFDLPRLPLTTVEKPVSDYSSLSGLVEMEAAGFFRIALKQSSIELVHSVKVVSDCPEHSLDDLNPKTAERLCENAWPTIEPCIEGFREVIGMDAGRIADPPELSAWTEQFRFSFTELHQLRRLLQACYALSDEKVEKPTKVVSGKMALNFLRERLQERRQNAFRL